MRKFLLSFYVRVYAVILFGLIYGMNGFPNRVTMLMPALLFGIQVVYLGVRNHRLFPSFSGQIALCLSKMIYFSYFRVYKGNFTQFKPDYHFMVACMTSLVVLVIIHRMQKKKGPRLILGKFFGNDNIHDYFFDSSTKTMKSFAEDEICPVCFEEYNNGSVDWDNELTELSGNLKDYVKQRNSPLMKTPCEHIFHTSCLISVMNFNMSCPTCRKPLPQIT